MNIHAMVILKQLTYCYGVLYYYSYVLFSFQEIVAIVPLIVFVSGFLTTMAAKPLNIYLGQRVSLLASFIALSGSF